MATYEVRFNREYIAEMEEEELAAFIEACDHALETGTLDEMRWSQVADSSLETERISDGAA